MAAIHSDEFKRDAVRIALTSGLTRRQVASDLGIGLSTLGKWVRAVSEEAKVPAQDAGRLARERTAAQSEPHSPGLSRKKKTVWGIVLPAIEYNVECRGTLTRSHLCRLPGVSERRPHT